MHRQPCEESIFQRRVCEPDARRPAHSWRRAAYKVPCVFCTEFLLEDVCVMFSKEGHHQQSSARATFSVHLQSSGKPPIYVILFSMLEPLLHLHLRKFPYQYVTVNRMDR